MRYLVLRTQRLAMSASRGEEKKELPYVLSKPVESISGRKEKRYDEILTTQFYQTRGSYQRRAHRRSKTTYESTFAHNSARVQGIISSHIPPNTL